MYELQWRSSQQTMGRFERNNETNTQNNVIWWRTANNGQLALDAGNNEQVGKWGIWNYPEEGDGEQLGEVCKGVT